MNKNNNYQLIFSFMKKSFLVFLIFLISLPLLTKAQGGINKDYKIINTAVPFLGISPDAKGAAMGDAGVASKPDANAIFWNTAKLAFAENKVGSSINYAPWLKDLVPDMGLLNAYGYYRLNDKQAITAGFTYFNQGLIEFTNSNAESAGNFQSREFTAVGGFAQKLNSDLSMGINIKLINSNLIGTTVVNGQAGKVGRTAAFDLGFYYKKNRPVDKDKMFNKTTDIAYGLVIQNLGGKVNYGGVGQYFIPANLKFGTSITRKIDEQNSFVLLLDFNKLLVPTPKDGINVSDIGIFNSVFSSFGDAPGGFKEELAEVMASIGTEFNFSNLLALRAGYFYESKQKNGRQYITTGVGLDFKNNLKFEAAYLIPTITNSPLANTWRFGVNYAIPSFSKRQEVGEDEIE
jgi:hypothetical protein